MNTAELTLYRGYTIAIDYDNDPMNPRDWDNFGTMICLHGRYSLGDIQGLDNQDLHSWTDIHDYIEKDLGGVIILPLHLYDHSGISIKVGSYRGLTPHYGWDTGQVGYIYCTQADIDVAGIDMAKAEEILLGEIKTYDRYLTGQVYTYRITKESTCETCNHTSENFEDSVSGWEDADIAMQEAMQVVDSLNGDRV